MIFFNLANVQDLFMFQWIKYIDILSSIIFRKSQTKEILNVTYLLSDAQASVNSGGAVYSITSWAYLVCSLIF